MCFHYRHLSEPIIGAFFVLRPRRYSLLASDDISLVFSPSLSNLKNVDSFLFRLIPEGCLMYEDSLSGWHAFCSFSSPAEIAVPPTLPGFANMRPTAVCFFHVSATPWEYWECWTIR